jgi:hypothetical protein
MIKHDRHMTQKQITGRLGMSKERMGYIIGLDWHCDRKNLGLCCIHFIFAACVCFPLSPTGASVPLRACGPLMGGPRTDLAKQSPLLARKESFGREMVDLISPYPFDFQVIVRDF